MGYITIVSWCTNRVPSITTGDLFPMPSYHNCSHFTRASIYSKFLSLIHDRGYPSICHMHHVFHVNKLTLTLKWHDALGHNWGYSSTMHSLPCTFLRVIVLCFHVMCVNVKFALHTVSIHVDWQTSNIYPIRRASWSEFLCISKSHNYKHKGAPLWCKPPKIDSNICNTSNARMTMPSFTLPRSSQSPLYSHVPCSQMGSISPNVHAEIERSQL